MKHSSFMATGFILTIIFFGASVQAEQSPEDPIQTLRSDIREMGHKAYTIWEFLNGAQEVMERTMADIEEQGPNFNEDYVAGEWAGAEYFIEKAYYLSGGLTERVKSILEQSQVEPDSEAHEAAVWLLDELKLVVEKQEVCHQTKLQLDSTVEAVFGAATNPNIQAHPAIFFGSAEIGCQTPLVDDAIAPVEELASKTRP